MNINVALRAEAPKLHSYSQDYNTSQVMNLEFFKSGACNM